MAANRKGRVLATSGQRAPEWGMRPMSPVGLAPAFISYREANAALRALQGQCDDPAILELMCRIARMAVAII